MSILWTVMLVAALWCDEVNVVLHGVANGSGSEDFLRLGGVYDPLLGQWVFPAPLLEPVCSLLDRLGYVWAVDDRDAPRTWAQRMFSEVAEHLHAELFMLLDGLFRRVGDDDSLALLKFAYAQKGR